MESVRAYSHYLTMKGQYIGLTTIDGHKPTVEEIEVRSEIRRACDHMARVLSTCTATDIASLTGYYSILYTIGYSRMPETTLLEKQRDRLLRLWQSGDRTIEESDVYGLLSDSMNNPQSAMPQATRRTFDRLRDGWVRTLKQHSTFPDTDTYERYRRLALIMRDNIDPWFGGNSTAAKRRWYETNRIADISTLGTKILTAYRQFLCSLFPAVLSASEMTRLDVAVLKELIARRDLDPYDRRAYQLALEYETRGAGI